MADYQSQYTGAAVDAAAFISQFFNISGAPSQGQILIANGQGRFMPDNMPIPTNIPTANITLSNPQNNNTSLNPGDPLNNMINAVNGKVNSNGGNGSQVNVSASASYNQEIALYTNYSLAQIVGYLYWKQRYGSAAEDITTNFSSSTVVPKQINFNNTYRNIQSIYIRFKNFRRISGTTEAIKIYLTLLGTNNQSITFDNVMVISQDSDDYYSGIVKLENYGDSFLLNSVTTRGITPLSNGEFSGVPSQSVHYTSLGSVVRGIIIGTDSNNSPFRQGEMLVHINYY